jgi:hypothetical protein
MYPPLAEPDTAVTWAVKQVVAEQSAEIIKYFRVASGVQPVASVIDPQAGKLEAARVAPDDVALLKNRDIRFLLPSKLPRRPDARGTRS